MKTKSLILCLMVTFIIALTAGSALATVRYVGTCGGIPQYATIQDAVNACNPYDTIIVCPGDYYETVLVDFSGNTEGVTITSTDLHDPDNTTLHGGFKIVSDYVTIKGFKITVGNDDNHLGVEISGGSATVAFNHIFACEYGGIRINGISSGYNNIAHNKIEENVYFGINVEGSANNVIHHNDFLNNAPVSQNFGGIFLSENSSYGNVHHNNTKGNKSWGIYVQGDNYNIHQNQVCDGIFLQTTANNIFLHQNVIKTPPGIVDNGATNVKEKQNSTPSTCPF